MSLRAEDVVRRFWESVWTSGNADELDEIFAAEVAINGEPVEVGTFKRMVQTWRASFPDFRATVEELTRVDDERIFSRVTYAGTHHGAWAGLPASGRSFEVIGIDIFRVRGGRIVELWHATDHYDVAVQLGAKLAADPLRGAT